MTATNLDLPVLMGADQIRRREFVVSRRGYDPGQVRDFLDQIADQLEQVESMLQEARIEADAAIRAASQPRVDPYNQLADRVAGLLRSADEEAERTRREAKEEADRILREARADADRIGLEAQARADETAERAERALRSAREQADLTIAGLATKREAVIDQLAEMQDRLMSVARDLGSTITLPELPTEPETADAATAYPKPSPWATAAEGDAGGRSDAGAEAPGEADADLEGSEEHRTEDGESQAPTDRTIVLGEAETLEAESTTPGEVSGQTELLDPVFEELWEGTETIELEVPDIPPLDLDWEDLETGEDGEPQQ